MLREYRVTGCPRWGSRCLVSRARGSQSRYNSSQAVFVADSDPSGSRNGSIVIRSYFTDRTVRASVPLGARRTTWSSSVAFIRARPRGEALLTWLRSGSTSSVPTDTHHSLYASRISIAHGSSEEDPRRLLDRSRRLRIDDFSSLNSSRKEANSSVYLA